MLDGRFPHRGWLLGVLVVGLGAGRIARADQPPVVVAPDTVTVRAGMQLNVDITAHDPDGDAITSLVMEGLPDAKFVRSVSNTSGWLAWTPPAADEGVHAVTFTASNALSGSATTWIHVLPPPIPPVVIFTVTPTSGIAPLEVTFDASASYDPDGTIVRYEFLFGDGTPSSSGGPIVGHHYERGNYVATVRMWDNDGAMATGTKSIHADGAPIAYMTADPTSGPAPLRVQFGAYRSYDPDGGTIVSYGWDFGDGRDELNGNPYAVHTFYTGQWTVTLTVTNAFGNTGSVSGVITVGPENHPPVVTVPSFVTGEAGQLLTVHASAYDPDGNPIEQLVMRSPPPGASTVESPDHSSADFHWTPSVADLGTRRFYFDAVTNGSSWYTPVIISIWAPGLPPNKAGNPSFETNLNGWAPYAGATIERVTGGRDGSFGLRISGPAATNGSFGVNDSPDVVHHTLIGGLAYRYIAWVRSSGSHGKAKLRVREYRVANGEFLGEATSVPVALTPDWQMLTVDYVTKGDDTTLDFQVRDFPVAASEVFDVDQIGVYEITGQPGTLVGVSSGDVVAEAPRVWPSPIRSSGTLSFAVSRRGRVRVELLDLGGRRVRRLLDDPDAAPRSYRLPIPTSAPSSLPPGVYFYRVETMDAVTTGRFVLLR